MSDVRERLQAALSDRYTIQRELGRGGMAVVYLARDLRLERRVAIKVLRPELTSVMAAERFLREIKLTANLHHPHILALHESGEADGLLYYVMPYVAGESLRGRLEREGRLPVDEAVRIAREVADALSYAHERDLLHRDIKPENILLEAGHALVADFGIAKALSEAAGDRLTDTGVSIGTPEYMSPEQAVGERELNEASDLYSLGCVLYEMLAGEAPVTDPSVQKIVSRKLLGDVRRVGELRPEVSAEIEAAVMRALATEPAERLSTAGEFTGALTSGIGVEHARRSKRRPRRWAAAAALVAVAAVAGLAWYVGWGRQAALEGETEVASTENAVALTRVAVFPFTVQGSSELSYLGEGVMELLGSALDGAGELRRADPYAVLSQLRKTGASGEIDIETARGVTRALGASHFVLGRLLELNGTVRISASLYSLAGDSTWESSQAGEVDELQELVNALARDILVYMEPVVGEFAGSIRTASTTSYGALRAYLRGQALMRRGADDSAWVEFKSAVEQDSLFALAWLGLAVAEHRMPRRFSAAQNLAQWERVRRLRARLSPRNRALLEVGHAFARGDVSAAERAARAMVTAYPDAAEGWMYLGETLSYPFAWQRGRLSVVEAERAFIRLLDLDPNSQLAQAHLSVLAYYDGRKAQGDSLRLRATGDYWVPPEDSLERARYFARLESLEFGALGTRSMAISLMTDSLSDAARVVALQTDRAREDSLLALGHHRGAWVSLARGRWQAARTHFGEANRLQPGLGVLERAWYSAFPFFELDSTTLRAIRDSLVAWTPPPTYIAEETQYPRDERSPRWLLPHAKQYILGLLSARLSDVDAAARYAELLESAHEPADSIALLHDLALEVRAFTAAERGDWEAALTLLADAELRGPGDFLAAFVWRPLGRLQRAEALMHLGRDTEALGWYSTLGLVYSEYVFIAPVQLREGEIYERLGDPAEAVRHYRRFVARWRDADPQYQPLVDDVRARIARLSADGTVE